MTDTATTGPVDTVDVEYVSCNLCGANEYRRMYSKPDTRYWLTEQMFDAVRCKRCGMGYVNPRPTRSAMRMFYPAKFYRGREVCFERDRYELQAAFLDSFPIGRVLDIGCAGGAFLRVLQERGWEVSGMDVFDIGRNDYGLPIQYGELPDLAYPSDYFNVVTSWAVFEHLHNPMAYFNEVGRILKPGGHFVCLVTNLNSVWSRFAYCEDIPRHLYFYTARSLARYASLNGLWLKRLDYSGSIIRPDSKDVFRINLLRLLGIGWREIFHLPNDRPQWIQVAERVAWRAGRVLLRNRLEAFLRISGIIVAVMEKNRST